MHTKNVLGFTVSVMMEQQNFFRNLGVRIAQLRKERGWSQAELGKRIGLSQQIVASYENGQRQHFPLCRIIELATVLGVDLTILLFGESGGAQKRGPASKMERQIEQVRQLSKSKQRFVSELLENVLK